MKIKFILFSLIFACLPLTLKPAAIPPQGPMGQGDDSVPLFHRFIQQYHPAQGHPAIPGETYQVPFITEHITRDGKENKISVKFQKIDFQYVVETLGRITNDSESSEVVKYLLKSSAVRELTPCIIEIANFGLSPVIFNYSNFSIDNAEYIGTNIKLVDELNFQWKNVPKIALQGLAIAGIFGAQALCVKLAADATQGDPNSSNSAETQSAFIQALQQAIIDSGIQLASLSAGGFCLKKILQYISLIKARWQVRDAITPIELPTTNLIERGGVKKVLFLVKSELCDYFAQKLLTNNFEKYIANSDTTTVDIPL